jgi:GNAT superfamily N-acetyltransferase
MNFYSEDIINNMLDKETDEVIEEIDSFKRSINYLIQSYSCRDIHYKYTNHLLKDEKVKIAFYCMDFEFSIFNCPAVLLYRKYFDRRTNEIKYYILLICTKRKFRNQGYASKLLDYFIERVKEENTNNNNNNNNKKIKIILSSTEESVLFYESYRFRWTRESLTDHPLLMVYEKYEEGKEYFILELFVE